MNVVGKLCWSHTVADESAAAAAIVIRTIIQIFVPSHSQLDTCPPFVSFSSLLTHYISSVHDDGLSTSNNFRNQTTRHLAQNVITGQTLRTLRNKGYWLQRSLMSVPSGWTIEHVSVYCSPRDYHHALDEPRKPQEVQKKCDWAWREGNLMMSQAGGYFFAFQGESDLDNYLNCESVLNYF